MSEEQNSWMIDAWRECEKCHGKGRMQYESVGPMSLNQKSFEGQLVKCDACPTDPTNSQKGTGKIKQSFTLKELFAEMKKAL